MSHPFIFASAIQWYGVDNLVSRNPPSDEYILLSDSQAVFQAISSNLPVQLLPENINLFCKIMHLLCKLKVSILWVFRDQNQLAHSLAATAKQTNEAFVCLTFC